MELKIEKLSPNECANIITCFLDGGSWENDIRKNLLPDLSNNPTKAEISKLIKERYELNEKNYEENIEKFLEWWESDGNFDYQELLNLMETKEPKNRESITWQVGDTFICPRDIEEWSFVMSASFWKWDAINVSLHEITHFVWFEKVKQIEGIKQFSQNQEDETYLPYWLLSEIVIEPILNSSTFAKKYEMTWKSYPEFYDIKIKNKNLMKYIKTLWNERQNFDDFYEKSSKFVYGNWREINKQYLNNFNNQNVEEYANIF